MKITPREKRRYSSFSGGQMEIDEGNTLLDLQNSSDDTKTDGNSIIVLLVF